MNIVNEILPGAYLISLTQSQDYRGEFIKTFQTSFFEKNQIDFELKEEFFSISRKNVIRGMHYQAPPHDHAKIVYCIAGAIQDVILDLRVGSSYGKHATVRLDSNEKNILYIPKGMAHGFCSLDENSIVVYKTNSEYAESHDFGIFWNSFGYDWKVSNPLLSKRDEAHIPFNEFESPF